jgi:hypothetical protein
VKTALGRRAIWCLIAQVKREGRGKEGEVAFSAIQNKI